MSARVHLIVSGSVQGVGYRAWVERQAGELELTGWVKNRIDETVELVAEGRRADLTTLIKRCRQGPAGAHVERIDVSWKRATGELAAFEVVY